MNVKFGVNKHLYRNSGRELARHCCRIGGRCSANSLRHFMGEETVTVYRPDGTVHLLHETDTLDGEGVVAGFTCPLAEIFG